MKKARFLIWLTKAFVQRHIQTVIIASVASFLLIILGWRYSGFVRNIIFPKHDRVGIVGLYTPPTLPRYIQEKISVGLTQIGPNQEVLPVVATSWDVKDKGKNYVFNVRNDLLWHDGKEFTANDINYNFEDAEIMPINKEVLKITLKEPFSPLPSLLSKPLFREAFTGLGPHKVTFISWRGEFIKDLKLEPLDPTTDIPQTIKFYPTLSHAETAFKLGEINSLRTIEKSSELLTWNRYLDIEEEINEQQFVTLLFNTSNGPFQEKQFRQALAYAISDQVTGGQIKTPIAETSWANNNSLKKISYNKERALELLEKSGGATESAQLTIHTFPNLMSAANEIRKSWEKLDIETTIKIVNTVPEEYSVLLTVQDIPEDPDQYLLWHSTQLDTNLTNYSNPKIDKLLEDGRTTFDLAKRKEIYDEFQRHIMDDLPAIYLYHPTIYTISRK